MDYTAHLIASLRLGYQTHLKSTYMRVNLFSVKILAFLVTLDYISGFHLYDQKTACVFLKYNSDGIPAIRNIIQISRRSHRIYWGLRQLKHYGAPLLYNTYGLLLFSTSAGLLWHPEVFDRGIGGELVLYLN